MLGTKGNTTEHITDVSLPLEAYIACQLKQRMTVPGIMSTGDNIIVSSYAMSAVPAVDKCRSLLVTGSIALIICSAVLCDIIDSV